MSVLEERRLGRTEMHPASIGLGAAWWGKSTEQETIAGIHRAIDLGINYLDTYPGEMEDRWGKALSGGKRDAVYLQAKVSRVAERKSDHSARATRNSLEASLRLLRTDYVDAVLIHGYDQPEHLDLDDMVDPLAPGNALDELQKMKEEGKLGHIGIGARSDDVVTRAIETGRIDMVLTYLEYNLLTQSAAQRMFPVCREHDVGVQLASPFGMGLLTGAVPEISEEKRKIPIKEPRVARMLEWCAERDINIRHLAIQFCLAAPVESIVLPGPASLHEVEDAVESATTNISDAIWEEFETEFGVTR
jgi:aryl-alcohol dehydrogenase-like predicted oxidoreductase